MQKRLLPTVLTVLGFWLASPVWSQPITVRVDIDMQAEIAAGRFKPETDSVGLRGNLAPLNWGRSVPLQAASAPGHYQTTLTLDQAPSPDAALQYKAKIDSPPQPQDGWETGRNHTLTLNTPVLQVQRAFNAAPQTAPLSRVGRIDRLPALPSQHIAPRGLQVWLPPGYEKDTTRRYPVLYLHDGQALFDTAEIAAEWQVDETAQRLITSGRIAPCIIVGIANTKDRIADYTPVPGLLGNFPGAPTQPVGGNAPAYGRYLVEELKPFIDKTYRTQPEVGATSVGGSSLGGLVSLWLLAHHPNTYGAALVVSPSVWWSERFILSDVRQQFASRSGPRPRIWLDVGLQEGPSVSADTRLLHADLLTLGWNDKTLRYTEQADGQHDEATWAKRVPGMLEFLYGTK